MSFPNFVLLKICHLAVCTVFIGVLCWASIDQIFAQFGPHVFLTSFFVYTYIPCRCRMGLKCDTFNSSIPRISQTCGRSLISCFWNEHYIVCIARDPWWIHLDTMTCRRIILRSARPEDGVWFFGPIVSLLLLSLYNLTLFFFLIFSNIRQP